QLPFAVHADEVKDIVRIVLVGEVLEQQFVAIGIDGPYQQRVQEMLGAQVLQLVRGGLIDFIAAHQEQAPGRNIEFEVRAVRDHVERLVPHHGVEPDQSDIAGLPKEDK